MFCPRSCQGRCFFSARPVDGDLVAGCTHEWSKAPALKVQHRGPLSILIFSATPQAPLWAVPQRWGRWVQVLGLVQQHVPQLQVVPQVVQAVPQVVVLVVLRQVVAPIFPQVVHLSVASLDVQQHPDCLRLVTLYRWAWKYVSNRLSLHA